MLNTKFPLDVSDPWAPHFHAIGAITVAWNELEDTVGRIMRQLTRFEPATADYLTTMLGNVSTSGLVRRLVEHADGRAEVVELVNHLLDGFEICRENRNTVLHSRFIVNYLAATQTLYKRAKTGEYNDFPGDLPSIQRVAMEIDSFATFSYRVYERVLSHPNAVIKSDMARALISGGNPPSPERPLVPSKLVPIPLAEARKNAPRQRQPSRAERKARRKAPPKDKQ